MDPCTEGACWPAHSHPLSRSSDTACPAHTQGTPGASPHISTRGWDHRSVTAPGTGAVWITPSQLGGLGIFLLVTAISVRREGHGSTPAFTSHPLVILVSQQTSEPPCGEG